MVEKREIQYRYYEIPPESSVLAVLGDKWGRPFGDGDDCFHYHNLLEIGYCYSGSGYIQFEHCKVSFTRGMFSVIPPNCVHRTVINQKEDCRWEYLFVDSGQFLTEIYGEDASIMKNLVAWIHYKPRIMPVSNKAFIGVLIMKILDLHREKEDLYLESSRGLLLTLLTSIAGLVPPEERNIKEVSEGYSVIAEALNYVGENYQQKIRIADMAHVCNLSETHFRRLFIHSMRMTPLEYVNLVRVEAACRHLRSSRESIQYIADSCGFFTLASFNRNFKALMHCSPMQWRSDRSLQDPRGISERRKHSESVTDEKEV
jgi:AraC-like DNA-binding protein